MPVVAYLRHFGNRYLLLTPTQLFCNSATRSSSVHSSWTYDNAVKLVIKNYYHVPCTCVNFLLHFYKQKPAFFPRSLGISFARALHHFMSIYYTTHHYTETDFSLQLSCPLQRTEIRTMWWQSKWCPPLFSTSYTEYLTFPGLKFLWLHKKQASAFRC